MLPTPQVSEVELRQIAKLSSDHTLMLEGSNLTEGDVTRGLLGEYGPTPMRAVAANAAARTAPLGDRIMMEAQNLARMTSMETPLMGGDNPELHPTDFSGMTPRGGPGLGGGLKGGVPGGGATPNPLLLLAAATPSASRAHMMLPPPPVGRSIAGLTPHLSGSVRGGPSSSFDSMTPSRGGGGARGGLMTPMVTPLRDELGLNDPDALPGGSSSLTLAQQRRQQMTLRGELRAGLGALPAPLNEYQIELPSTAGQDDAMDEDEGAVEDAADARARRAREAEARRQEEEKKKSKALQRGLPRPTEFDFLSPTLRPIEAREGLSVEHKAEELLRVSVREI